MNEEVIASLIVMVAGLLIFFFGGKYVDFVNKINAPLLNFLGLGERADKVFEKTRSFDSGFMSFFGLLFFFVGFLALLYYSQ